MVTVTGARFSVAAGGALAALLACSFSLACRLATDPAFAAARGGTAAALLMEETRKALGGEFDEMADVYFHRGVSHREEEAPAGVFQRLEDVVSPRTHVHLTSAEIFQIMPWLRFATRVNPHDMDAYMSAAFWVSQQGKDYRRQALGILEEARRNNPRDYRVPMERGMVLLHYGELGGAARSFDQALRRWGETAGVDARQKQIDRAALDNYRGFLYELDGRTSDALACYRDYMRQMPEDHGMRETIRRVEAGGRPRRELERTLDVLTRRTVTPEEYAREAEGGVRTPR